MNIIRKNETVLLQGRDGSLGIIAKVTEDQEGEIIKCRSLLPRSGDEMMIPIHFIVARNVPLWVYKKLERELS